jgi:hypothetical protein
MMAKLTKAQLTFLRDMAADPRGRQTAVSNYGPAKILVELGYAELFAGRFSSFFEITPAGRAALAEHQP